MTLALVVLPGAAASTTPPNCDVTGDGNIDIADVQRVINEALGIVSVADDLNGDGVVNAGDVQLVVNAARGLGCGSGAGAGPVITDFNPKSGSPGTLVDIAGSNFGSTAQIAISQQGGGTLGPPLVSSSATAVSFVLPAGAATGPIRITTASGTAVSPASFTVTPSSGFTLAATPQSANLIQGQAVSYAISLAGTSGFDQLAQLSVSGLPAGITAVFQPTSIADGQTSVLTLTAPANQAAGAVTLTVSATAVVEGLPVTGSASPSLSVVAPTTALIGRTVVADPLETSLSGVTVSTLGKDGNGNTTSCTGHTAISDRAGNFALTNLPADCTGPQLIGFDGTTANSPPGEYAGVNLVFTLVSDQVTASPVLVHLPRIDTVETFMVRQNAAADQTHAFTSIPGLSVTAYANTTFTMPDGSTPDPFPLAAVQVPVDRLPDAKPNVPTMMRVFIVAFQPANATANQPVAVWFPNVSNTPPGTSMVLMTLDPTHGTMVPYGTGTVSADGAQVVPDQDPAHPGHRYGLVHFDWHGQMPPPPNQANPAPDHSPGCRKGGNPPSDPCQTGTPPGGGEPVDLASGIHVLTATDISLHGARGSISIHRIYRTMTTNDGPFGLGSQFDYGLLLDTGVPDSALAIHLIEPDGNQFLFSRQADRTLLNSSIPSMQGAVMTTNPSGQTTLRYRDGTVYTFQASGLISTLVSIADRYSNTTTLTQTQLALLVPRITAITDPIGRSLTLSYDSNFHVTSVADPIGRTVKYTYNPTGTLASVTDPAGGVTTYDYDDQNRIKSMTDARGVVLFVDSYDANGRVSQQVLPDGGVVQFSYLLANPLAATSPVIAATITDALGRQTVYRFNVQGFVTEAADPRGQTKIFVRDTGTNQLLQVVGPAQCPVCGPAGRGAMSYTYDGQGNRLSITDTLGDATHFTYDPVFSQVTSVTDALNHTRTFQYDNLGNLTTSTDENGHSTTYTYDSYGQPLTVTDPVGNRVSITYDSAENPVTVTDPLGNTVTRKFDNLSRLHLTIDPLGRQTAIHYDLLDRTASKVDGLGQSVLFTYDAVGNLVKLTDRRNHDTTFAFDGLNRLKTSTNSLGKTASYTYDLAGNLAQFTDRKGQVSSFQYDNLNRLTGESYQDGSTVAYSYDPYSRLLSVNDSTGGAFTYAYDAAGRTIVENEPNGTVRYTRDALGRVATRQVTGQSAVTYSYDPAGDLSGAAMPAANVTYTYDARNLLTQVSRSNGISSAVNYDAIGRVLSLVHSKGVAARNTQAYSYDADGGRAAATNDISQALTTPESTATLDAANELLTNGQTTYTYDDNGNRLTETDPSGSYTYTWDSRNRLASITDGSGRRTSFRYDFARNLIELDRTAGAVTSQKFVLDSLTNIVSLTDASGLPVSVLTGTGIDTHLASVDASGNVTFGIDDPLGTITAITDSNGNVTATLKYEPFGQTTGASPVSYPFAYTGRIAVVGNILYYRNRLYDARAGRFLSEDPIGFAGGDSNLYRYAGDDPVNGRDPTGLSNDFGGGHTIGISAGAFAGLGGEGGFEQIHLDNCTCQNFLFIGAGVGFGGWGGSAQGGPVFNVSEPDDYAGGFITAEGGAGGAGGSASIGTPCIPGLGCSGASTAAITGGFQIGAGGAFTARWYWAVGPPFNCSPPQ